MRVLRQAVFWAHLLTALTVGVVVLIMSVTGVLLTYERQMQWWADTWGLDGSPPAESAVRMDPEVLLDRMRVAIDDEPSAVTWRSQPDAPVAVAFGRSRTVYVNAYTGAVLGEGSQAMREFFSWATDWHRWLGQEGEGRRTGRAITGAANLGFLFIVLSGLYLWWPRKWNRGAVRNVTLFRRGLSGKARDFNWHNVIGFWSAVPLAIIVASAVMISYSWGTDLVYRIAGEGAGSGGGAAAAVEEGTGGLEQAAPERGRVPTSAELRSRAEQQVESWRSVTLQIPPSPTEEVTFAIDAGTGGQPQRRSTLVLSRETGEVVRWEPFSSGTPGRRLRSILRFAHTGEVLGVFGQTLAGLVSLGAVFLVWTGFSLSWRRFGGWRRRRRKPLARRMDRQPREPVGTA